MSKTVKHRLLSALVIGLGTCHASLGTEYDPDPSVVLRMGYGFDPNDPASPKQTPFIDTNTMRWENPLGVQEYYFRLDWASSASSLQSAMFRSAELAGRYTFVSGKGRFDSGISEQVTRSSLNVNVTYVVDYGPQWLSNWNASNLNAIAKSMQTSPAGWQALYGPEVVVGRRRGAKAIATISFNSMNSSRVEYWRAQLQASATFGVGSGSLSAAFGSVVSQALAQQEASITVQGIGGAGPTELPVLGDPTNFQSYLDTMKGFVESISRPTSAVTSYYTAKAETYVNDALNPFSLNVGSSYLRWVDVYTKWLVCKDYAANRDTKYVWVPQGTATTPRTMAYLKAKELALSVRENELFDFGKQQVESPETVTGSMPGDIEVLWPRIWPGYQVFNQIEPWPDYMWVKVTLNGCTKATTPYIWQPLYNHWSVMNYVTSKNASTHVWEMRFTLPQRDVFGPKVIIRVFDSNGAVVFDHAGTNPFWSS